MRRTNSHARLCVPSAAFHVKDKMSQPMTSDDAIARLAAIVESSHDAIISNTLDGAITTWNAGAERLYGYSAPEVIGKSIAILIPPEVLDDVRGILERIRDGDRVSPYETERIRKDGSIVPVSLTVSPIRDASGTITAVSAIARDISDWRQAQKQLRQQFEMLTAMRAIDAVILGSMDLSFTLNLILDQVVAGLGAAAARILLLAPDNGMLQFGAGRGFSAQGAARASIPMADGREGGSTVENRPDHMTNPDQGG
jgi:PAS domain S-box-containing protein